MANNRNNKHLVWIEGEIKTPPFSEDARIEAGHHLRKLQQGEKLEMPHSRPMPSIGNNCHELRINDKNVTWRIIYKITDDMIAIGEVFKKKSNKTPQKVIKNSKKRFKTLE